MKRQDQSPELVRAFQIEDEAEQVIAHDITPEVPRLRVPSPAEVEEREEKYQPGDVVKTEGEVLPPKADPISSGTAKPSGPPIGKDYEGFISWALDKIAHFDDGGALETFWNTEIEIHDKVLFPPDYTDLADAYGKQQTKLNGDGE